MKIGKWIFWLSLLFWLAETAYFGFNTRPTCPTERWLDIVFQFGVSTGFFIMFFSVVRWVEEHKKQPHVKIAMINRTDN